MVVRMLAVKALNEKLVGYVDEGVDYPKVVEEGEPFVDVFALVIEVCLGEGPGELLEGGGELRVAGDALCGIVIELTCRRRKTFETRDFGTQRIRAFRATLINPSNQSAHK